MFTRSILAAAVTLVSLDAAANDEILVTKQVTTAAKVEQNLIDVLPSASVITRWEIERSAAPTLVDLIQSQPGIEIGRNGGPGALASIFMRGQASENVAIFIDGVRLQTDNYGIAKLIDIPTNQIERVEILRGNMSALYGEAAIGGAIHIFTRHKIKQPGTTFVATVGSRSTSDLNVAYGGRSADLAYTLSLAQFKTTNPSAINTEQHSNANPDQDPYERRSVFASLEKEVNQDTSIGAQVNRIESQVSYDSSSTWPVASLPTDIHSSDQTSQDTTLYLNVKPIDDLASRLSITRSKFTYNDFKNGAESSRSQGNQTSVNIGNLLSLQSDSLSFGVDLTDAEFESYGDKFTRNSLGYFAGYHGKTRGNFDYQLNLRHDEIDADIGSSTITNTADTWLGGIGYRLSDTTKLTGLYSTSFRAPASAQLANTPTLKAEEHEGFELGVQQRGQNWTGRLVKFHSDTSNLISYIGGTWGSNNYENIGKSSNEGYELEISGQLAPFNYGFSYVIQDPRDNDGNRLARRARNYAALDLNGFIKGYDWELKIVRSGNRIDGANQLEPYTVVNLSLSRKLATNWSAVFKVENLFDEEYQLAYGYDATPQGAFLTIQYQP